MRALHIKINDEMDTTFNSRGGRFSKIYNSPEGHLNYFEYKSWKGFIRAVGKVLTRPPKIIEYISKGYELIIKILKEGYGSADYCAGVRFPFLPKHLKLIQ